jgi:predicted transcriptional regulator
MSATLTIRIDDATKAGLEEIVKGTQRSKSCIASAALESYIKRRVWLQAKIDKADASGVLTEDEAKSLFAELEQGLDEEA